jgi:uncharacterized repeat protein (TIGR03803 family)
MLCSRMALLVFVALSAVVSANAQTYTVIHQFSDGADGGAPIVGLTVAANDKFYGSASDGGQLGAGTVFQLQLRNSGWILTPLSTFSFVNENSIGPDSRVLVGSDSSLYGTTYSQGVHGCQDNLGCGLVYKLRPLLNVCRSALCYWTSTVLYTFSGNADGAYPEGDLIFGRTGVLYGTTFAGGNSGCQSGTHDNCGVVYSLTTAGAYGSIYTFQGGSDGSSPASGVIEDQAGNLYGTTSQGGGQGCSGQGCGTVFELSPNGSGWTETILYRFQGTTDGSSPMAGLIFDSAGNLYGTTETGGAGGGGTAFELTSSGGQWTFHLLFGFTAPGQGQSLPGPHASLAMDAAGNLYGTTMYDGAAGHGAIFKLTFSGGGWNYTSLHDFTGGTDGGEPTSNVVFDSQGNLYGTASAAGTGEGVAWQIVP